MVYIRKGENENIHLFAFFNGRIKHFEVHPRGWEKI